MSNSSQPTDYSTISTGSMDTITISSIDTIDIGNTITYVSSPSYSYSPSISLPSGITVGSTVSFPSITSIDTSSFTINIPVEWVDCFPDWNRVDDMCKKYPALEIALRNFKTVYQLVKDDYDNPTPKK